MNAAAVPSPAEVRVLYCEGNTDGTIGGSYFSLLYLIQGLKGTRYKPCVVFHRANPLQPRFAEAGADVLVLEKRPPVHFRAVDSAFATAPPGRGRAGPAPPAGAELHAVPRDRLRIRRLLEKLRIALLHLNNSVTRATSGCWRLC